VVAEPFEVEHASTEFAEVSKRTHKVRGFPPAVLKKFWNYNPCSYHLLFSSLSETKENYFMSYRRHRTAVAMQLDDLGEPFMSHKPTDISTPDPSQLEKPRIVSVTSPKERLSPTENQPEPDKSKRSSSSINTNALEKKLRLAESQLQQPEENQNTAEMSFADSMGANVGNMDQVRDILFGGQMRDYDKRFKRLEERFSQENINFREDIFQRLKAVEEQVSGELESLIEKNKVERQERVNALQDLEHEIKTLKKELNSRFTQLDEQIARDIRNLRQQTLNKFQELTLQIRQQNDNLTNLVNQEVTQLHDEKVDRADLASFFHDMAVRLTKNYEESSDLE